MLVISVFAPFRINETNDLRATFLQSKDKIREKFPFCSVVEVRDKQIV